MAKVNAIIVEDEKRGMEKIATMLASLFPNINIIEKCYEGETAIQAIKKHNPQLVFLDVELGGMQGFDVLKEVEHINFEVIITTAHKEYGINAVNAGAIAYILKPFDADDLKGAIEKAVKKIESTPLTLRNKIALPDTYGLTLVKVSDIMYCKAENNATIFYLASSPKPLYIIKTLKQVLSKLNSATHGFYRIDRSKVINIEYMAAYSKLDGGKVIMENGIELPAIKGKFRDEFLKIIANMR